MKLHFFWLLLLPFLSYARWATYEDSSSKMVERIQSDTVHADGTWESELIETIEILKEGGRESATARRLYYNENAEKLDILEAYTIKKGKKYKVDPASIEDKPLASTGLGFDQINQVLVIFPHVEVGSRVYWKYKRSVKKVSLGKVFATVIFWGQGCFYEKSHYTLRSALPLKIKINDPFNVLEVKNGEKEKNQEILIKQRKPIYTETVNDGSWVHPDYLTWVSLSNLDTWEDLPRLFSVGWEQILAHPLPPGFEAIVQKACKKKTEVDQLNEVTSLLNQAIQYMGDWRTVEGKYWPRSLRKIADTHIGDCKDFSAVTVAILRKLGFQAYVALVNRGLEVRDFESALPFSDANHAMVKAVGKSGKVYWVDPTNTLTMAQGLFPDIAGKRAFVVNPQNPTCEKIPEIDPSKSEVLSERTISIEKDGSIRVIGQGMLKGESALDLAGIGLVLSLKAIEEQIIRGLAGEQLEEDDHRTLEAPDLTKQIVEDLTFKYGYHQKQGVIRTNKGYYLGLKTIFSLVTAEDPISDMFMGSHPFTATKALLIKGKIVENIEVLNAEIKTPWIDAKRTCSKEKDYVRVEDVLTLKTKFIPAKDLKGTVYKNLVKDLKRYFDVGIVFEPD